MPKFITVKIPEPDISDLTPREIEIYVQLIAEDLAAQIMKGVKDQQREQEILYWRRRLLEWDIEDYNNQLKYGHLDEREAGNQQPGTVDSSEKPKDS